jgi:hypothetical protein
VTSTMANDGGLWPAGRMTVYGVILFLSVVLPAAGAQYAKSPGAPYYLLLAVGPAEVVALLLWMTLRRQAGIKEALYSSGWVVFACFVLSAVAIVVGGGSGQWGIA